MNQELKQILVDFRIKADMAYSEVKDGVYTQKEYEATHERLLDQAHSAILETIKKALPEDMDTDGSYGKYPSGWNECLSQIKSNLGVD